MQHPMLFDFRGRVQQTVNSNMIPAAAQGRLQRRLTRGERSCLRVCRAAILPGTSKAENCRSELRLSRFRNFHPGNRWALSISRTCCRPTTSNARSGRKRRLQAERWRTAEAIDVRPAWNVTWRSPVSRARPSRRSGSHAGFDQTVTAQNRRSSE